eukprot:PRCOL_00003307-RA
MSPPAAVAPPPPLPAAAATFRQYRNDGGGGNDDPRTAVTSRVEAFYKEQHERQTVEFVRAMEARYTPAPARRAPGMPRMGVWEAAELLDTIIDDSDPDTSLSQIEHCMQTAEALRAAFPGEEHGWLHLTGFIHDLGKVLAHPAFGCLPQWAVVGDTYPVACAPDPLVVYHEHFAGCPDARVEAYARKHGVYSPGCGLDNVHMSWGHDEYIYRVLRAHAPCVLPPEALFICRYHSFYALHQHGAYEWMLTAEERHTMLPWLRTFQRFDLYSKDDDNRLDVRALRPYYESLIDTYVPGVLQW